MKMDLTIQNIAQSLKEGIYSSNPHGAADALAWLCGEYSFIAGQLEDIAVKKARAWETLRAKNKSDASTEREWERTESGIDEIGLNLREKSVTQLCSGLRVLIRLSEKQLQQI